MTMVATPAARCRYCGAPIRWARTTNGRAMPLNFAPNTAGNVSLTADPVGGTPTATVHKGPPGMLDQWTPYMPHFVTCPKYPKKGRRHR